MKVIQLLADIAADKVTVGSGDNAINNLPTVSANDFFHNGLNLVYALGGSVAVIIIIIAGIMYATSAGDSARIAKAKNAILYSVIGLVVIAAAFTITQFVIGRFTS